MGVGLCIAYATVFPDPVWSAIAMSSPFVIDSNLQRCEAIIGVVVQGANVCLWHMLGGISNSRKLTQLTGYVKVGKSRILPVQFEARQMHRSRRNHLLAQKTMPASHRQPQISKP